MIYEKNKKGAMMKKRPLSLTVIGWYEIIAGAYMCIASLIYFVPIISLKKLFMGHLLSNIFNVGFLGIQSAVFCIITGICTLKLRKESPLLNVILGCLLITAFIYSLIIFINTVMTISSYKFQMGSLYFVKFLFIGLTIIFFFTRKKVKAYFN